MNTNVLSAVTPEEASERLAVLRRAYDRSTEELTVMLTEDKQTVQLGTELARRASIEGESQVVARFIHVVDWIAEELGRGGTDAYDDALSECIRTVVTHGPDDTWSGRTNDLRRAAFDGELAALRFLSKGML